MSCLTEERIVEMLDGGGLEAATDPEQSHLESCGACQDAWASVAAAAEVLGETRPRRVGRFGLGFPVLAAAAVLLAIVGVVLLRPGDAGGRKQAPRTAGELVNELVEGREKESRGARDLLFSRGPEVLPALVASRKRHQSSARYAVLQDLIYALKRARHSDDPEKLAILGKLESMRVDLSFNQTGLKDVLDFVRDFSRLNLVLDPGLPEQAGAAKINLALKDTPLREVLDLICTVGDLDFDLRYGVVWVSAPRRLWLGAGGDAAGVLPLNNHWADQLLEGEDKEAADKLRSIRVTIDMANAPFSAVVVYLKEISGMKLELAPGVADRPVSLRLSDILLEHVLEVITIPFGLDARIEAGTVRLMVPR